MVFSPGSLPVIFFKTEYFQFCDTEMDVGMMCLDIVMRIGGEGLAISMLDSRSAGLVLWFGMA